MSSKASSRSPAREEYPGEAHAESSALVNENEEELNTLEDEEGSQIKDGDESDEGFGKGMLPEGFAGPKIVQPLTQEALAAFKAAQDKAGVVYISRIPPGMRPSKVRHLMSTHGEVGRVYLQQEGMLV